MLSFFAIIVFVASSECFTQEQIERLIKGHEECYGVSHADPSFVDRARHGDFVPDPKFKEHIFCFAKLLGIQNDSGEIQIAEMVDKLDGELKDEKFTTELVQKCAVPQDTPQDTIYEFGKCIYFNTPMHFSLA